MWCGILARSTLSPIFVKPGAKINANYYIEEVLKPFIKDAKRLYPNSTYLFQQDSAPSHRVKKTVEFLEANDVKFISPDKWIPNSPDVAPCDYFLWGYIKSRINKLNIQTKIGLKNAIRAEFRKLDQDKVNRALKAWPKRCRQVYYAKGGNIEKHR